MKYDEYLNHKSILDCDADKNLERHNEDLCEMLNILQKKAPYGAVAKFSYQDEAHKHKSASYRLISSDEYFSVSEALDIKNGVDAVVHDGKFGLAAYGQGYSFLGSKTRNLVEELISFDFIKDQDTFDKLSEKIDSFSNLKKINKLLENFCEDNSNFLDQEEILAGVRSVKRDPIDIQIQKIIDMQNSSTKGKDKNKTKSKSHDDQIK